MGAGEERSEVGERAGGIHRSERRTETDATHESSKIPHEREGALVTKLERHLRNEVQRTERYESFVNDPKPTGLIQAAEDAREMLKEYLRLMDNCRCDGCKAYLGEGEYAPETR
jgi:hypothetical protein